jgi:hypothetical protein
MPIANGRTRLLVRFSITGFVGSVGVGSFRWGFSITGFVGSVGVGSSSRWGLSITGFVGPLGVLSFCCEFSIVLTVLLTTSGVNVYSVYGINYAAGRLPFNKGVEKNGDLLQICVRYLQALSTSAIAVLAVTARTRPDAYNPLHGDNPLFRMLDSNMSHGIMPPHRDGADPSTPAANASVAAADSAVL